MSTGRLPGLLSAAAGLAVAGLAAGCAEGPTQASRSAGAEPETYENRSASSTGYPFRPAPFYRIDELDELTSEKGYTAGY